MYLLYEYKAQRVQILTLHVPEKLEEGAALMSQRGGTLFATLPGGGAEVAVLEGLGSQVLLNLLNLLNLLAVPVQKVQILAAVRRWQCWRAWGRGRCSLYSIYLLYQHESTNTGGGAEVAVLEGLGLQALLDLLNLLALLVQKYTY